VNAADIRAVVRSPDKVADFAARGVGVVAGDYTNRKRWFRPSRAPTGCC
jgi:uncharacterized protein YbjT (DUF2867 family)